MLNVDFISDLDTLPPPPPELSKEPYPYPDIDDDQPAADHSRNTDTDPGLDPDFCSDITDSDHDQLDYLEGVKIEHIYVYLCLSTHSFLPFQVFTQFFPFPSTTLTWLFGIWLHHSGRNYLHMVTIH